MGSKRYVHSLTLWLLLVLLLMMALNFALVVKHWYFTSAGLFILIILTIATLLKKIDTANQRLVSFFKMIFSGESAGYFPENKQGLGFEELNKQLNQLSRKINALEHTRKREESLFSAMVQHLDVGIFLLDEEQRLQLANPTAQAFLNVRSTADRQMLEQRAPHFTRQLQALREKHKVMLEVERQGETQKWQLRRTPLKSDGKHYELFLVTNLQAELERKESEVTEKLLHTLTHEIMNSISPVTSLADTLQIMLDDLDDSQSSVTIPQERFSDLRTTANIIQKRGHGLVAFVERYGMLARLPRLRMERLEAESVLKELSTLMQEELTKQHITLEIQTESRNIIFRADKQLLLQVLINLIKNASEAYNGKAGNIQVKAAKGDGYTFLTIYDQAGGVPPEIRRDIFLPFFSTKDKGSGIGLSLSRKIIQAHNGRLYLKSHEGGAEFRVELAD